MSAETKFTPGPWVADYHGSRGHIKSVPTDSKPGVTPTPTVCRYDYTAPSISNESKKANAHLIAAAPELYEALSGLLYHDENGIGEGYDEVIEAARLALTKARGEQNV